MRRVFSIIFAIIILALLLTMREKKVDENIFTKFQFDQPKLAERATLFFPSITSINTTKTDALPKELQDIIPLGSSAIVAKKVSYEKEFSGFFIGGKKVIKDPGIFSQSYAGQVFESGWRTTVLVYFEDSALREIENAQYQARVVFLDGAFGIFIMKKNAL
jgi:hypothetical protein